MVRIYDGETFREELNDISELKLEPSEKIFHQQTDGNGITSIFISGGVDDRVGELLSLIDNYLTSKKQIFSIQENLDNINMKNDYGDFDFNIIWKNNGKNNVTSIQQHDVELTIIGKKYSSKPETNTIYRHLHQIVKEHIANWGLSYSMSEEKYLDKIQSYEISYTFNQYVDTITEEDVPQFNETDPIATHMIGTLTDLKTNNKTNLVNATNENTDKINSLIAKQNDYKELTFNIVGDKVVLTTPQPLVANKLYEVVVKLVTQFPADTQPTIDYVNQYFDNSIGIKEKHDTELDGLWYTMQIDNSATQFTGLETGLEYSQHIYTTDTPYKKIPQMVEKIFLREVDYV